MLSTSTTISVATAFVALTLNFVTINAENCDLLGGNFYERLGCTGKFSNDSQCPIAYDCPKFKISHDYCTFKNKRYEFGERINGTSYCNIGCFCENRNVSCLPRNPITCAAVDCPYYPENEGKNCYNVQQPGGCCPLKQICEPFGCIEKCEFNGKTYMEGQLMDTGDTCLICVCKKSFGDVFEPYCVRTPCDFEIYTSEQVANKCAPIYTPSKENKALCCPWTFLCPKTVVDLNIKKNCNPDRQKGKCSFMHHKFNVGDTFVAQYKEKDLIKSINCSCLLPPQVSCIQ